MASLDFCLVVGVQSTKETFGIKMGSFSVEISQLSTDHPLQSNIPIFDKSGVHLANITLSIAVVYSSEYLLDSAIERPPWDSIENVLQSLRDTENVPLSDYSGKVELIAGTIYLQHLKQIKNIRQDRTFSTSNCSRFLVPLRLLPTPHLQLNLLVQAHAKDYGLQGVRGAY